MIIPHDHALTVLPRLPNILILDTVDIVRRFREEMAQLTDASYDLDEIVISILETMSKLPLHSESFKDLAWQQVRRRDSYDQIVMGQLIHDLAITIGGQLYQIGIRNQSEVAMYVMVGWMQRQLVLVHRKRLEHVQAQSGLAAWMQRHGVARLDMGRGLLHPNVY